MEERAEELLDRSMQEPHIPHHLQEQEVAMHSFIGEIQFQEILLIKFLMEEVLYLLEIQLFMLDGLKIHSHTMLELQHVMFCRDVIHHYLQQADHLMELDLCRLILQRAHLTLE